MRNALFTSTLYLGWKQKEYPVLINAFHMGDQILRQKSINSKVQNLKNFNKSLKELSFFLKHK